MMTKPIKKKTPTDYELPVVSFTDADKTRLLDMLSIDVKSKDTNAIIKQIEQQMAFLISAHKHAGTDLRATDYVNDCTKLEKLSGALLNELEDTHIDIMYEIHMEFAQAQADQLYFTNNFNGDEELKLIALDSELNKLLNALASIKKWHSGNESRGASKQDVPKRVINILREIFKTHTSIANEAPIQKGACKFLSDYKEQEANFIASVMNLTSSQYSTGKRPDYWDKTKVRMLYNDKK